MGDAEKKASPSTCEQTVSDDDEIDYETKPDFYDSELDDKDQRWVSKGRNTDGDAVLSCPACFTTLCLDSQRHEIYVTQYRALFVVNCEIMDKTVLVPQGGQKRRKKRKGREYVEAEVRSESELVRQVCCSVCSAEVGVIDKDEVYHFYHVLPSES